MITEIATLTIDPGRAKDFEAAVARASSHFRTAEGCRGMLLARVFENPALYHLIVRWDSVDHHMVKFRESPGFRAWREQAGPFFVAAPQVIHTSLVAAYFHE
jgi:quinol monooxygenase YgiN